MMHIKITARTGDGAEDNRSRNDESATHGEIIAMADYPTFDSNDPRDLSKL